MPHPLRPYYLSALLLTLLTVVCSRLPLFNYLGFEFSAVMAVAGGFVLGLLVLNRLRTSAADSVKHYRKAVAAVTGIALAISVLPGLLMLANALAVKNCSLSNGILLYALLVFPSVLFCAALATVIDVLLRRWRKTAFVVAFLAILAHIAVVGLTGPQIFAFNPIIGYFPGFTYDESLQVAYRLALYRVTTVVAAVSLFAMSAILWRIRTRSSGGHASAHAHPHALLEWILIALCVPSCVVVFVMSDRMGFSSSESYIRQKLGGRHVSRGLEFVYPPGAITASQIERTAAAQEFAVHRMTQELGLGPQERITVFIYASPEQKGRLVGARGTDISKPWLRQVHINAGDAQQVLTHELAHVVAASFGFSPLRISRNPGLIEGTAVALERRAYEEPLPTAAALVASTGASLDLRPLFSVTGFATASPSVAYTLAGSFLRFLLQSRGPAAFKALYASGDFEETCGKPLEGLLAEWRAEVDSIRLDDGAKEKARYFFKRPSIFMKECARVIAQTNEETARLLDEQRYEEALQSADASMALSRTPEAIYQRTRALSGLRRFDDLRHSALAALSDPGLADALLPLRLRLGDAYWSLGRVDSSVEQYQHLLHTHLSTWYDELCAVRIEAVQSGRPQAAFWTVLTREVPDSVRRQELAAISHPLARYLLGQDLLSREHFAEAVAVLSSVGPMPRRELEFHRLRRMGRAWFELEEYAKAANLFAAARRIARPAELLEVDDMLARCAWMQR